mmetsp:Transcript_101151/g.241109  ORF Transcript_101151/g.241109 Transcript_101151/m.241109 type:complete len:214 (+) Transcript_101151:1074-1715(+)
MRGLRLAGLKLGLHHGLARLAGLCPAPGLPGHLQGLSGRRQGCQGVLSRQLPARELDEHLRFTHAAAELPEEVQRFAGSLRCILCGSCETTGCHEAPGARLHLWILHLLSDIEDEVCRVHGLLAITSLQVCRGHDLQQHICKSGIVLLPLKVCFCIGGGDNSFYGLCLRKLDRSQCNLHGCLGTAAVSRSAFNLCGLLLHLCKGLFWLQLAAS